MKLSNSTRVYNLIELRQELIEQTERLMNADKTNRLRDEIGKTRRLRPSTLHAIRDLMLADIRDQQVEAALELYRLGVTLDEGPIVLPRSDEVKPEVIGVVNIAGSATAEDMARISEATRQGARDTCKAFAVPAEQLPAANKTVADAYVTSSQLDKAIAELREWVKGPRRV